MVSIQEEKGIHTTNVYVPISMLNKLEIGKRVCLTHVTEGEINGKTYLNLSETYGRIEIV
jgi:hypothetical protein